MYFKKRRAKDDFFKGEIINYLELNCELLCQKDFSDSVKDTRHTHHIWPGN